VVPFLIGLIDRTRSVPSGRFDDTDLILKKVFFRRTWLVTESLAKLAGFQVV